MEKADKMSLLFKKPLPELESYIHGYCSMKLTKENIANNYQTGSFRVPNSRIRMAFHFSESIPHIEIRGKKEYQAKYHVRGFQTSALTFKTNNHLDVFSIELTPYGFREMFSIPCSELTIVPISMEEIIGEDYGMLTEELTKRISFNDRVNFMNLYFLSRAKFDHQIKKAKMIQNYLLEFKAIPNVKLLAKEIFITERTLRRFFKDQFGMSPKRYLKLLRFEKAIKAFSSEKKDAILYNIALDFGYYDHAHFANEFKLFMSMTPRDYQENILNKGVMVN